MHGYIRAIRLFEFERENIQRLPARAIWITIVTGSRSRCKFAVKSRNTHVIKDIFCFTISLKFRDVAAWRSANVKRNFDVISTFETEVNKVWTSQGHNAIWRQQRERKFGLSSNSVGISGKRPLKPTNWWKVHREDQLLAVRWCLSGSNGSKTAEHRCKKKKAGAGNLK